MTPMQFVKRANPKATLDFYEMLRGAGMPCWFIRDGLQGLPYTGICKSPRAAWKEAHASLLAAIKENRRGRAAW